MDLLYVVQMDGHGEGAYQTSIDATYQWLANKVVDFEIECKTLDDCEKSVSVRVPNSSSTNGILRIASAADSHEIAKQIELQQSQESGRTNFVTSITIGKTTFGVQVRIALGLENVNEQLTPPEFSRVSPPKLVRILTDKVAMRWLVQGQIVTSAYSKITSSTELEILLESLGNDKRLPVVVVDTVNPNHLQLAKEAADGLIGMASVVCLPAGYLIRRFNYKYPSMAIPFGGARLIWPNLSIRHNEFSSEDIANRDRTMRQLQALLFKTSTVSRSRNQIWTNAQAADRKYKSEVANAVFNDLLQEAVEAGDKDEQIELLRKQIEVNEQRKEDEFRDLVDENKRAIEQARELETQKNMLESKVAFLQTRLNQTLETGKVLSELPSGPENFEELFQELELRTSGSILFTPNAFSSWQRSQQPRPSKVERALIDLAEASVAWRGAEAQVGNNLAIWLRHRLGVDVPMQDSELENLSLDTFTFDGQMYSRLPHVKVSDATDPSNVARVYFAVDTSNLRFIVDHVGSKLY